MTIYEKFRQNISKLKLYEKLHKIQKFLSNNKKFYNFFLNLEHVNGLHRDRFHQNLKIFEQLDHK